VPRLRARSINRRFGIAPERLGEVLADARLILAGSAAARALAWDFPSPSPSSDEWPLEAYVAEGQLAAVFEQYQLERDEPGELLLRSVTEPWPFPPHTRVVPPSNARVIGVVEGGLGAQRAPVLGLFFDATARVLDVQAGQDPVGDDAGSKASRRVGKDPANRRGVEYVSAANTRATSGRRAGIPREVPRVCRSQRMRGLACPPRQVDAAWLVAARLPQAASHPAC
jgi:hypothetical protein